MTEMPLLVFTLIEQTTVGAFATLAVLHFMGKVKAGKTSFVISAALAVLAVLGMVASLMHLGQPGRAFNALAGIGSSPLSHEILFFGLFVACVAVYAILAKMEKDAVAKIVGGIGAACGLLAVVFTSVCYMMPGVPAWDSPLTPIQFFLTVAACGIPLCLALEATLEGAVAKKKNLWWGVFAGLLVTQVAMRWFFYSDIVTLVASM